MLRDPLIVYASKSIDADASLTDLAKGISANASESHAAETYGKFAEAAVRGVPFAMCMCARLSLAGLGTSKSEDAARGWIEAAVATGFAPALYELGRYFEEGIGSVKDPQKAVELYEASANAGFGLGAFRLGLASYRGDFGGVNVTKAIEWMEQAGKLGESLGLVTMGDWYKSGEKVPRDDDAAVHCFKLASDLGDPLASYSLMFAYTVGQLGLPRDPSLAKYYEELNAQQAAAY